MALFGKKKKEQAQEAERLAQLPPCPFGRVTIAGVGLLGGSLGLALKKKRLAEEVVGVGRNAGRLEQARDMGAIDRFTTKMQEGCEGADVVVLCGPVSVIIDQMAEALYWAPEGAVVTDVGSTKRSIVASASDILEARASFVGSHPMAGSEKTGAANARGDLYDGATVVLTPDLTTGDAALEKIRDFWSKIGMKVIEMLPARHDEMLAQVSHLPHLAAVMLVEQLARGAGDHLDMAVRVAGPGFRDTTRIAKGSAEMWADIFMDNDTALLESLSRLQAVMVDFRHAIQSGNRRRLVEMLEIAAESREEFDKE